MNIEIAIYTAKVWVTNALLAPVIFLSYLFITSYGFDGGLSTLPSIYIASAVIELCCSFITALLFCLSVTIIVQQDLHPAKQRQALLISALVFGSLTFAAFFALFSVSAEDLFSNIFITVVVTSNLACLALSTILYKIS